MPMTAADGPLRPEGGNTLYITPAFYIYLDKFTKYLSPKPVSEIEAETAAAAGMAK